MSENKFKEWCKVELFGHNVIARVALGHVPLDPHEESYVVITNHRLFKLVGIDLANAKKLLKFA